MITTQALDWPGVLIEAGRNNIAAVDDVEIDLHCLSVNTDNKPYSYEAKGPHGFNRITVPPGGMWVSPAGNPLTGRLDSVHAYATLSFDPGRLGHLIADGEGPVRIRPTTMLYAPAIANLVTVLVAEARRKNPGGLAVVDAVSSAIAHLLLRNVGIDRRTEKVSRGGLAGPARRRALEMIDAGIGARLTIETLAQEVGLSPAHFARAFKTTFGRPPHHYLLSIRLARARRDLELSGANLSAIAQQWGFADQAHFTRLFKRAFGLTPGTLLRDHRRSRATDEERSTVTGE
jgi:AraC family transcriptional regulator